MQLFSAPEFVNWNYTYACNLRCLHCYSRCGHYPLELDTDAYLDIARTLGDAGVFTVSFGGGEPLMRDDLLPVNEVLTRRGVTTYLTTNGWFLTQQTAAELHAGGLNKLLVSLDHALPDVNDRIRGSGSHERAVQALHTALTAGLRCAISCVTSSQNVQDLQAVVDLAASLGVHEVELKRFRPSGNGLLNAEMFALDVGDEQLSEVFAGLDRSGVEDVRFVGLDEFSDEKRCPCGWRSLCLRPNGDLTHCPYSDRIVGNLSEQPLRELWLENALLSELRVARSCEGAEGVKAPSNPRGERRRPVALGLKTVDR